MTDFQAAAGEYLALRRALGFKLIQAERILRSFTSYLHEQGAPAITTRMPAISIRLKPRMQEV